MPTPEQIEAAIPQVDPRRQYVSAWVTNTIADLLNALPQTIDEIEKEIGADTYERMMNDSAVGAAVDTLREMVLDAGLTVSPAIDPPKEGEQASAEYQRAAEIADFMRAAISDVDTGLDEALYEMLLALPLGWQVAEIILKDAPKGMLHLDKIACRPHKNLQPVVDEAMRLIGFRARRIGEPWGQVSIVLDPKEVLPRYKFAVLTFAPRNGDPRGTSGIRRAYNAWMIKTKVWPAVFRFLMQFGIPSLVGITGENSPPTVEIEDPLTHEKTAVTPEEALRVALTQFYQNGSVVVVRGPSTIGTIESSSKGEAFQMGIDLLDREITRGITLQIRATMEALHGSKADSETGKDILDVRIRRLQNWLTAMVRRDIFRLIVSVNFSEEDAALYTPKASLAGVNRPDFQKIASGVGSLYSGGYLADEQLPATDDMLGLPPRDMNAWRAKKAADEDMRRQQAAEVSRLMNPTADEEAPAGNGKRAPKEAAPQE